MYSFPISTNCWCWFICLPLAQSSFFNSFTNITQSTFIMRCSLVWQQCKWVCVLKLRPNGLMSKRECCALYIPTSHHSVIKIRGKINCRISVELLLMPKDNVTFSYFQNIEILISLISLLFISVPITTRSVKTKEDHMSSGGKYRKMCVNTPKVFQTWLILIQSAYLLLNTGAYV